MAQARGREVDCREERVMSGGAHRNAMLILGAEIMLASMSNDLRSRCDTTGLQMSEGNWKGGRKWPSMNYCTNSVFRVALIVTETSRKITIKKAKTSKRLQALWDK